MLTTNTGRNHRIAGTVPVLLGLFMTTMIAAAPSASSPALKATFQAELEQIVEQYGLPGATAAYTLADGTTVSVSAGQADIATGLDMRPDTPMLAASIGKTFVAAIMLSLHQEGRLDLDDPLSRWLGDRTWFGRLPNASTITLRQLLRHQSGLPDHVNNPAFLTTWQNRRQDGDTPFQPEDLIAFVLDDAPLFPAGTAWSYSDTGYLLLGLVIEEANEDSYYETVANRFLDPLGLHATKPSDRPELPGLATGYLSPDNELGLPPSTTLRPGIMAWNPSLEWTGGGLVSNARDLSRWAWILWGGRGLDTPYLKTLLQAVPIDSDPAGPQYGLGVGIRPEGPLGRSWGHGGWIPGYVSSLRYYPDQDISVAFQVNTDIGLLGPGSRIGEDMEVRLARIVLRASRKQN